jgi:hypothetical protein
MYQEMHTTGSIISNNENIKWEGHSDGNTGIMKIMRDMNGNKTTETLKFTKDELEELLNQTVNEMPIDQRLIRDFMRDSVPQKMITSNNNSTRRKSSRVKSTRRKRKNNKNNK